MFKLEKINLCILAFLAESINILITFVSFPKKLDKFDLCLYILSVPLLLLLVLLLLKQMDFGSNLYDGFLLFDKNGFTNTSCWDPSLVLSLELIEYLLFESFF